MQSTQTFFSRLSLFTLKRCWTYLERAPHKNCTTKEQKGLLGLFELDIATFQIQKPFEPHLRWSRLSAGHKSDSGHPQFLRNRKYTHKSLKSTHLSMSPKWLKYKRVQSWKAKHWFTLDIWVKLKGIFDKERSFCCSNEIFFPTWSVSMLFYYQFWSDSAWRRIEGDTVVFSSCCF